MPGGAGNKWTKDSEVDLLMAFILDEDFQPKPNWTKVVDKMTAWGHQYTKSGMQQHFNLMLRAFKQRRDGEAYATPVPTPRKISRGTKRKADGAGGSVSKITGGGGFKRTDKNDYYSDSSGVEIVENPIKHEKTPPEQVDLTSPMIIHPKAEPQQKLEGSSNADLGPCPAPVPLDDDDARSETMAPTDFRGSILGDY